jgi:hypothetical protein
MKAKKAVKRLNKDRGATVRGHRPISKEHERFGRTPWLSESSRNSGENGGQFPKFAEGREKAAGQSRNCNAAAFNRRGQDQDFYGC